MNNNNINKYWGKNVEIELESIKKYESEQLNIDGLSN